MNAPPKGSCESVSNVPEACVGKNNESKQLLEWMAQPGHYRGVFSIDRPPLLAGCYAPPVREKASVGAKSKEMIPTRRVRPRAGWNFQYLAAATEEAASNG